MPWSHVVKKGLQAFVLIRSTIDSKLNCDPKAEALECSSSPPCDESAFSGRQSSRETSESRNSTLLIAESNDAINGNSEEVLLQKNAFERAIGDL